MPSPSCIKPLPLYQGDTWNPTISLQNPDGTAFDASSYTPSGILHVGTVATPVSAGNNVELSQGLIQLVVPPSLTTPIPADPDEQPFNPVYPTRLQVILTDTAGASRTVAVIPIQVRAA